MNDNPPPSPELISALRDQAFEEIGRVSDLAASYSRSLGEAAYRGDQTTVEAHLKQLRSCCLNMIKAYNEFLKDG